MSLDQRIVFGRSYIETLFLTARFEEMRTRDISTLVNIAKRLEEEICALIYANKGLKKLFKETVTEILRETFPQLPIPEINSCRIFDTLQDWIYSHLNEILGLKTFSLTSTDTSKTVSEITLFIVRTAQQALLYQTGILTIRPRRRA